MLQEVKEANSDEEEDSDTPEKPVAKPVSLTTKKTEIETEIIAQQPNIEHCLQYYTKLGETNPHAKPSGIKANHDSDSMYSDPDCPPIAIDNLSEEDEVDDKLFKNIAKVKSNEERKFVNKLSSLVSSDSMKANTSSKGLDEESKPQFMSQDSFSSLKAPESVGRVTEQKSKKKTMLEQRD